MDKENSHLFKKKLHHLSVCKNPIYNKKLQRNLHEILNVRQTYIRIHNHKFVTFHSDSLLKSLQSIITFYPPFKLLPVDIWQDNVHLLWQIHDTVNVAVCFRTCKSKLKVTHRVIIVLQGRKLKQYRLWCFSFSISL